MSTVATRSLAAASTSRKPAPSTLGASTTELEAAFFYPYDAIVKKWESYLVWKGVTKGYPKKFLAQPALISGSTEARDHPIWGRSHVFYKCEDTKSGALGLYFIDSDMEALLDIFIKKQPQLNREAISPNDSRKIAFHSFKSVVPVTFPTIQHLQSFRSKQVSTGDTLLLSMNRRSFQHFQDGRSGTIMAIDIESYERNHAFILEIGWSSIAFSKSPDTDETLETRSCEHIIVSDYTHLRNGNFTPNNRYKFDFGTSEELSRNQSIKLLTDLIESYRTSGPLFLIFHSASSEIAYFAGLGMDTTKWVIGLPDPSFWNDPVPPTQDGLPELRFREGAVYVMDTQRLFNASGLPEAQRQVGLENALKTLEIPYRYLHNAGNDACYTLALYEALVGSGRIRDELIAQDKLKKAQLKPKGRRGEYSGWE